MTKDTMEPRSRTDRTSARRRLAVLAALAAAGAVHVLAPREAGADPVWLCHPGNTNNPCEPGLDTTLVSPSGEVRGVRHVLAPRFPKVDCFYVYPTVSDQPTANANLNIDPEERSIALYQAARYSGQCRVFAPMYRQVTLAGILGQASGADPNLAYSDVLDAWNSYLQNDNNGRGVVLIGHSQGTFVLRRLITEQIDPNPGERQRVVSAILLGGNVTVHQGQDVGGDFQNVPACRSPQQTGCAIAFSTFNAPVPQNALFGRATAPLQVLCTSPARLRGGTAPLKSVFPTAPFAPGTIIGGATPAVGFTVPSVLTTWVEVDGAYRGACSSADDANVLQTTAVDGAPHLHPVPDPTWGLHLVDGNIALGNLTHLVEEEARAFVAQRHCRFQKDVGWSDCGGTSSRP